MENHIRKVIAVLLLLCQSALAEVYYLGVLAPQGAAATQAKFQHWLDALNAQLGADSLILLPLNLQELAQQIEQQQLHFILAPPSQLIHHDTHGFQWLASLAANPQAQAMNQIGSTIWVKQHSPFKELSDLKGKRIAAVNERAFAGYLLGLYLFQKAGVLERDMRVQFVGYPIENTLYALKNDEVDAAIVPLCVLEEMAQSALLNAHDFRPLRLNQQIHHETHCAASSAIYPHWTLAATPKAPPQLITQIHRFLFQEQSALPPQLPSIKWQPATSHQAIEQIMIDLNRHPSQRDLWQQLRHFLREHQSAWIVLVLIFSVSTINYIWMSAMFIRQRRKIHHQHQQLREYDGLLNQHEKLSLVGELSAGIAHEINQPLSAIHHYAEGAMIYLQQSPPNHQALIFALEQIKQQSQRSAKIIHNIRFWTQKQKSEYQLINGLEVSRQCLLSLGKAFHHLNIYQSLQPYTLSLPNLLLDQILINLLLNAKQQNAQHIFITTHTKRDNQQNFLHISIIDDGGGFRPSQIADFYQSERQRQLMESTKMGGTGLGLNICRRLCQSVGGHLTISNLDVAAWLNDDTHKALGKWQYQPEYYQLEKTNSPTLLSPTIGANVTLILPL